MPLQLKFTCDIPGVPQGFIDQHPYETDDILSCRRLDQDLYEVTMKNGEVLIWDDILEGTRRPYQGCYNLQEAEQIWMREMSYRLRDILRVRNMTAKELSELTGISQQSMSGYIHASNNIPAFRLFKICKALNISIEYFTDTIDIF